VHVEVPRGNFSRVNNTALPRYDEPPGDVYFDNPQDFPSLGATEKKGLAIAPEWDQIYSISLFCYNVSHFFFNSRYGILRVPINLASRGNALLQKLTSLNIQFEWFEILW
jgi:hypothetical protein